MFGKVLIANRGEIAVRVIRTLKEMGIKSVAAYSQADMSSMAVRMADEAICIGPASAAKSYLDINAVIAAAKITGADAIHPGYGFLSENDKFAEVCDEAGITFIGPDAETMRLLGNKSAARRMAAAAGIPITPGSAGCVSAEQAAAEALRIGYPVMIKAAAGGGGKGIRIAENEKDLLHEYQVAAAEAMASFGNPDLYFERLIRNPKHIEVQFVRDCHGGTIAFPERDCSIQRRHQKLIEETPSPSVSPEDRKRIADYAIRLANAADYIGAGTVEFLADGNGTFYFMEVNARLQVEHPITEAVTGQDLVRLQIIAAAGESLPGTDGNCKNITMLPIGHSIEMRINAEDPENNFRPAAGKVDGLALPAGPGIRNDTHLYDGYSVPVYYDSLLAKVVAHAPDREQATSRAIRALEELEIGGITNTADICRQILSCEEFRSGRAYTSFAEEFISKRKKI